MKKQILFFAVAALALASCSSENDVVQSPDVQQTVDEATAVNFDFYVGRGLTRGGVNGPVDNTNIKTADDPHQKAGFGVFGYYTDGEPYSAITKPNFFYNQQVTYDAANSKWTYEPIKYWPNEFGSDAASDQVDRVTLFAYLPWVDVDAITGVTKAAGSTASDEEKKAKDPTTNITGMTRNTSTGDPFIKYVATMDPTNSVDLCYGVAAEKFTSSNSAINQNEIEKGKPYIDVKKPGTDANSKIKFDFKHATAQLKVTIDANVTDLTTPGNTVQTAYTRIWVRSVTFTGITQKGSLNLNSNADSPEWYDLNGNSKITTGSLTVYDGRKDGKEANDAASNELPATLNPTIVQAKQYKLTDGTPKTIDEPTEKGVTETRVDLFGNGTSAAPVFVIPTKEKMRVTIVYDVETYDPNLPYFLSDGKTPGSSIENTIYKDIETFGEIEAGYCYTLNLHLGMRTVDFDAEVTPWQEYGADVDLPSNLQTFAATSAGATGTITLPYDVTSYDFAVSGLKVNQAINVTGFTLDGSSLNPTATPVNSAGITMINVSSITPNTTQQKKTGAWNVTDGANTIDISVTQMPAPLGMTISSVEAKKIVLDKPAGRSNWSDLVTDAKITEGKFKVTRNGQSMLIKTSGTADADNEVVWTAGGHLTFKNNFIPGDVITVWIEPLDAAPESVTANIGGVIYPAPATKALTYQQADYAAYLPKYYGPGSATYSWNSSDPSVAALDGDGKIDTKKAGTGITITATLSTPTAEEAKALGWYYLTTSATYNLTVNRQEAVGTFDTPSTALSGAYTGGSTIKDLSELFTFKGKNDKLESADGDVTYTFEVKDADNNDVSSKFEIDTDNKTLKVKASEGAIAGGDYTVIVTASMADGDKYAAVDKEGSFTITSTNP